MAQLLVRDVPSDLIEALERRAAANGRSVEEEHRHILEAALRTSQGDFWEQARELRKAMRGRTMADSTDLIREDRESR
jgi:plasmid stability protein